MWCDLIILSCQIVLGGAQMRQEIKRLDVKLTTTSMKLVDEKTCLRRKEHLKTRLKDLASYEAATGEIQALKVFQHLTFQSRYIEKTTEQRPIHV